MKIHTCRIEEIIIPKNRQRKQFLEDKICELSASIADNGLIHPPTVRLENGDLMLVAGECRLKALQLTWDLGQEVRCGTQTFPEGVVPYIFVGEMDPIAAYEVELEENIRRTDITWQERAQATSQLYELRRVQAEKAGAPAPTVASIAVEIAGSAEGQHHEHVRQDIILARNLDNPVVAKATSRKEAFKLLKRDEETKRHEELGRTVGKTFSREMHKLLQGDCLQLMDSIPDASFDVILTDPPYGIGAQDYGDSGGKTAGAHQYDDSPENFRLEAPKWMHAITRLAKDQSHLYWFCDIEWFDFLKVNLDSIGWKPFRTPFIWVNPTAMRAPWPEQGPQRKWQAILYAVKGNKPVTRLYSDVLTYPSDENLGHQAQKPVGLYLDLLRRSVGPGDLVLDPFCGTGTILPAAHELKCKATAMEKNEAAYGIAVKRLGGLK